MTDMSIRLRIDTDDRRLAFDLMNNPPSVGSGSSTAIPGDATLTLESLFVRKALGLPETLEFVLNLGTGVGSGLVANWLYGRLKNRNVVLRIEEEEVQIEEGEIRKALSRIIELRK
jgi:hypothetical protein